jgi:hypothetical protein
MVNTVLTEAQLATDALAYDQRNLGMESGVVSLEAGG